MPALVVDIIVVEWKRCTSNQYSYFNTSNNATINTKRIFVKRRRIRWIMTWERIYHYATTENYLDTISASLKNRTFGNFIHWQTNQLEDDPAPILDEEKNLRDDEVVEWLMMCWHVVLLIDDWETQQSITVEEMSETGQPSCYNSNSSQCEWDVLYHSLVSENKIGDMRGH